MHEESLPPDVLAALADLDDSKSAQLERVWHTLGEQRATDRFPPTSEAWNDLQQRIPPRPATPAVRRPDRPPLLRTNRVRAGVALAVVLLIAIGTALWAQRPVTVTAPPGSVVEHVLPDGSNLALAPDSEVRYARGFARWPFGAAELRAVNLRGEAFFDVAPNTRPMIVETHDALVEVLGTSFSVRARSGDLSSATRVSVERGSVRLTARRHAADGVILTAGALATVSPTGAPVVRHRPDEVAAWRAGGFAIHELPLGDVLREIERRFAVTIRASPDLPYNTPITLFYRRGVAAETLLHDVALAAGLEYRSIRGGYEVAPLAPGNP